MKIKMLYVFNVILLMAALFVLFFSSVFWLGTKEQHQRIVVNGTISYFFGRVLISFVVGFISILIIYLVNLIYIRILRIESKEIRVLKLAFIELLILAIASVIFVLLGMDF